MAFSLYEQRYFVRLEIFGESVFSQKWHNFGSLVVFVTTTFALIVILLSVSGLIPRKCAISFFLCLEQFDLNFSKISLVLTFEEGGEKKPSGV